MTLEQQKALALRNFHSWFNRSDKELISIISEVFQMGVDAGIIIGKSYDNKSERKLKISPSEFDKGYTKFKERKNNKGLEEE